MKNALRTNISKTRLEVEAILGKTSLKIRQIIELKKGDVVVLQQKANDPIPVDVGQKRTFLGSPGIYGKKKGVQIVSILQEQAK